MNKNKIYKANEKFKFKINKYNDLENLYSVSQPWVANSVVQCSGKWLSSVFGVVYTSLCTVFVRVCEINVCELLAHMNYRLDKHIYLLI